MSVPVLVCGRHRELAEKMKAMFAPHGYDYKYICTSEQEFKDTFAPLSHEDRPKVILVGGGFDENAANEVKANADGVPVLCVPAQLMQEQGPPAVMKYLLDELSKLNLKQ
eukprot:TRINITY_DN5216_c1_g1_i2.p1 TRINITY_DN5216_c1_g1~~TRINITY_DN5216_c1_g1_i2.p1  ORF type:complete len:110 (-),score=29.44 TRINITY_DN5216_c1_g1_i2:105-434(-)